MSKPRSKQIIDDNFGSYVNISPSTSELTDTLIALDTAVAGSSSPWTETAGKVRLATVTNEVELPNGVVGTPVLAYTSEPTTGLYRVASGEFGITVLGTRHAVFNGNNATLELGSTGQNIWNAESTSVVNFYGSSASTTELLAGRIATASQTAHSIVRLRAGGAIASGATNSNAVNLILEVGQATGDGDDADIDFYTYAGGGISGTAVRSTALHSRLEGLTGYFKLGTSGENIWNAQSSAFVNFYGSSASTTELLAGRIATASQTAHSIVRLRAGGAIASGATDSNAVNLILEVGQATGDGDDANIDFYTYAGGGAPGTAVRSTALHSRLEGLTGYFKLGTSGENIWNAQSSAFVNFYGSSAATTELLVGKTATASQTAHTIVTIRAGGAVGSGATDSNAVALKLEVGQATGDGAAADIDFYTYEGGGAPGVTIRTTTHHSKMDGASGALLVNSAGVEATPVLTVGASTVSGIYEPSVDAWAVSTSSTQALSIDTSQNVTIPNGNLSLTGTILAIGVQAATFTSLNGGILELAAVTAAPTASPGTTNGGLFVDGQDLKYIQPDDTIVNLTGVWKRSGTVITLANASDFVHVDGTAAQLGVGIGTGPTGGTGGTNALVLKDKAADFTTGVASALALFANGSDLKTIDASNVVRCLLASDEGAICETGSYTGNASDPQTVNIVKTTLLPKLVLIYGDPGAASPVDGASANMGAKFGSSMSIVWKDNAGAPTILMETAAISAVATGSFNVGGSLNLSSTGYHYMIIGTE